MRRWCDEHVEHVERDVIFLLVGFHVSYQRFVPFEKSENGISAGNARHVTAECKYDEHAEDFLYEIASEHPITTQTPVSRPVHVHAKSHNT